jgi:fermentation-respiration switch protein FrsA (DUF1100 family)
MVTSAKRISLAGESEAPDALLQTGGSGWSARRVAGVLAVGAAGLLFGGLPLWGAHRILHPIALATLPADAHDDIDVGPEVAAERVTFRGLTGEPLGGWFVPAPEGTERPWPAVVLVHGYGGYKEQMAGYARMLRAGGFATLMFDMEGSGTRRGKPVSLGFRERWQLMGAVRFLRARPDVDPDRIGVLGVSMGAATALLAAAEDPFIKAIVSDSGYANVVEMVAPGLKAFLGLPPFPFAPLIVHWAETILGVKARDIVPERAAAALGDRPLLVIHGVDDALVAPDSAHRLYAAASGPKELWLVENCLHARAPEICALDYEQRVNGFFANALKRLNV